MEEELVKMSEKGQLVVPRRIREKEGFKNSDRFIAIDVKGGVIFKKVDIPKITAEFETLAREVEARFKKQKIKKKDVEEAVKWAREK
jgi:bifunctional DNA-binding transcriptional regulator/antitoxin component of YhaV-PrlF toxin-antitoxin module